jgi:hypothetical protein
LALPGYPRKRESKTWGFGARLRLALACALPLTSAIADETVPVATATAGPIDTTAIDPIPVVYRDQYLFDDSSPSGGGYAQRGYVAEPYGRRYLEIETAYYGAEDNRFGDDLEQGIALGFGRETLNWGTIDIEASLADIESDYMSREASGSYGIRHAASQ